MAERFEAFNTGMGLVQEQNDSKGKVVRKNIVVNLGNTLSLLPNTTSTSSSICNISLAISPHLDPTYTIPQMPSTYTPDQVAIIPNSQFSIATTQFEKSKENELVISPYRRPGKEIKSLYHEELGKELHNLRKVVNEELCSRNFQILKYEDLCVHPNVELPSGYKIPKFNTFNGKGDPVAHLKDYCSRLIGIGHIEAIRMRLFIQSLSGSTLSWYTKQDFSKWLTWEDMAREFIKQFEFNNGSDPHIADLLRVKKMPHESFQEYAIRWRLEASKIHPPLSERELISTFIQIQEDLYYDKLLGVCAHNFSDLIRIGRELENAIQEGRITDSSATQAVHQTFQAKIPRNLQSEMKGNQFASTTMHQAQCHKSHQIFQSYATMQCPRQRNSQQGYQQRFHQAHSSSQHQKKRKSFCFTTLNEPLANIFERLSAKGILQPKEGFIPKHPPPNFDLSKSCAYHSNIQGHDIEECPALRFKIQSMIESGKIKLQLEPSTGNIANTKTTVVKGDPSKLAPRHLKRKRATSQAV
ncbi:uncharacterized protein LOC132611125 [Lycium barbarum]|uniref:uncharacterized protein LOC132611125 n=1 Tax=Lycium barbarum TaxID=112863 RepID=UPI00293EB44A|nr:uncharacterized protein LOC132611125 [Lycium barbarum]